MKKLLFFLLLTSCSPDYKLLEQKAKELCSCHNGVYFIKDEYGHHNANCSDGMLFIDIENIEKIYPLCGNKNEY